MSVTVRLTHRRRDEITVELVDEGGETFTIAARYAAEQKNEGEPVCVTFKAPVKFNGDYVSGFVVCLELLEGITVEPSDSYKFLPLKAGLLGRSSKCVHDGRWGMERDHHARYADR